MRVLLLSALVGTVLGADAVCDPDCTTAIYTKVATVAAGNAGYKDGDMAVYGWLLYQGYTGAVAAGAAGSAGLAYIDGALEEIGTICAANDFDANTKDGITKCLKAAKAADLETFNTENAKDADFKEINEGIIGAIANQLAPGSVFAKAFKGLTAAQYADALNVYYVVGAFYDVFIVIETAGVFADQNAKDACYTKVGEAIGYTDGDDFAIKLTQKAAEGAAAFADAACFGADGTAPGGAATPTELTTALQAKVTGVAANVTTQKAEVDKLVKAGQPKAETDEDTTTSGAAVVSALVAAVALML